MWSYYGRKIRIVKYYPRPLFDRIVEPFAGTAVYSLHKNNWENQVVLVDKDPVIVLVWKYLQQCSANDILKLPNMKPGEDLRNFKQLSNEERCLMGFYANRGSIAPRNIVSRWYERQPNYWTNRKMDIAHNLHKIRHWKILNGSYELLDNELSTWFIDPPYQFGGECYKYSNREIDFQDLKIWVKGRFGQVIVCESDKAVWMDFKPLISSCCQRGKRMECVHHSVNTKLKPEDDKGHAKRV